MPKPQKNEKKQAYISRCIPIAKKENPGKKRMHYILKCQALWDKYHGA